jgi:GntR family transcriptional regulator/MocR family aminotransferase
VAAYLGRVRGVVCTPEQVIIVNGCAQGFVLLGQVFQATGSAPLGLEDPGSPSFREQLDKVIRLVPLTADKDGIDPRELDGSDVRSLLVTPAHHYPLGGVLTAERRSTIANWARSSSCWVIEDDYDAEFRYDHAPIGAFQSLEPDRIVYVGSVSKTLAPALRLGWVVAPKDLVEAVVTAKRRADLHSPVIEQLALNHFLLDGEYDRHIRASRRSHRQRRDALVESVADYLPSATVVGTAAGVHAVVELDDSMKEIDVVAAAAEMGIAIRPLGSCRWNPRGPSGLVLGFGHLSPDTIRAGIKRLAIATRRQS